MEVILLERVGKLGQMGDVVRVKDGFARNFLLPRGKALRATADNKKRFEGMKAELPDETQVVYVSPLKALSNDIRKNLQEPLAGIRALLQKTEGHPPLQGDGAASDAQ